MKDLLDIILATAADPAQEPRLQEEIEGHARFLRTSAGKGNRDLVSQAEHAVQEKPGGTFVHNDAGSSTLTVAGSIWCAGRFETLSIRELRARANARVQGSARGRVRLFVFDGASPVTDIGSLQATNSTSTLFQVASQFNCLESPGPYVSPVAKYFHDPTQGPRASISAFPATLLRHYAAPGPDGERFVQESDGRQIDLLADACGPGAARNGYFTGAGKEPRALAAALENYFEAIRVGVHDDAQVVLGYNWDGAVEDSEYRRIAQVFTSTVAGGGYGGKAKLGKAFEAVCSQLLRAAYLGTLLAALALGRTRVALTLIGGGVFGNPIPLIWDAIQWALDEVKPYLGQDLDVVLNGYNLGTLTDLDSLILPGVRNRGGVILKFNAKGFSEICR